ncbi:hypothetical protein C4K00_1171 [Pseudomonas synxantha]|nr:hypothetical protein C4K00_1171 [Pseudomonas synxantha]
MSIYPALNLLSLPQAHVHKFSFPHPSMSFFNRSRVAVRAFISYHFRK